MKRETIELKSSELKENLKYLIENNINIQKDGEIPVAVEIIGEAGLGKTSVILQVANELNMDVVKLNLSQLEELGDLIGVPVKEYLLNKVNYKKVKYKNKAGEILVKDVEDTDSPKNEIWVAESEIPSYTGDGYKLTGRKRMSYCIPEWMEGRERGMILLLDDYSRADLRFTQATMDLIDRQAYMGWSLPEGSTIILSSNPDNGDYFVTTMDNAQKTRYASLGMKFDVEDWAAWAELNSVDSRCINFILQHPEIIAGEINPRCVTTFFKSIKSIDDFAQNIDKIYIWSAGTIGATAGAVFTQWINNKQDKMITPKRILFEGNHMEIIKELKDVLYDNGNFRADIASVITNRIVNYTIAHSEKGGSIDSKLIDRLESLIVEPGLFNIDLKFIIAKKLVGYNRVKFQKLVAIKEVQSLLTA